MRHPNFLPSTTTTTTTMSNHHHNNHRKQSTTTTALCRNHPPSATATLDLLILILVLISVTFLLTSYFSYVINSLSLLLSHPSFLHNFTAVYIAGFVVAFAAVASVFAACCGGGSGGGGGGGRRCGNPKCKGLKKAMEFDLQVQSEECLKNGNEVLDRLPWKGGTEGNPDYECLRAELRKMAPVNGRAVLLFRAKCGCPLAKLVGWGPKKGRKHKKSLANATSNGDHR